MRLTIPIRIFIITGLVVSFIYVPACNESSRTVNSANPELTNSTVPYAATPEDPSSTTYTIQSSSSGTGASLDAYNGDGVELSFDVLSSDQYSLTGSLNVTTPTESPSSDPLKVNPMYEVYNDIPNDITF